MSRTNQQQRDPEVEGYWSPRQLAEYWSVSLKTVGRWRRAGVIPAVLLPTGVFRFNPVQVEQVLTGDSEAELSWDQSA